MTNGKAPRIIIGVSPTAFFLGGGACRLASKYKVACHGRNTLTKNGGSTLRFGPPTRPQNVSAPLPIIRFKTSKLSYSTHRMLIRKLLTRQTDLKEPQCCIYNTFFKICTGKGMTITGILFIVCIFQNIGSRVL